MTGPEFTIDRACFERLHGKTVVFTGGASGIGREAVTLFAQHGANVVFGDVNKTEGDKLAQELGPNVLCHQTDVTSLQSLKALFAAATAKFGPPEIVCANAGIHEKEDWLSEAYLEADSAWPSVAVNFVAVLNTIKLALLSFRRSGKAGSIVLTASASGYQDSAPVCAYSGTKHAVVGLLRSFKTIVPVYNGSRINLVAPWMTDTPFAGDEVMRKWGDLPKNSPLGCALAIVYAAAHPDLNGAGIWVGGNRYYEVEAGYALTRPIWLGEDMSDKFQQGWNLLSRPFGKGGELSALH